MVLNGNDHDFSRDLSSKNPEGYHFYGRWLSREKIHPWKLNISPLEAMMKIGSQNPKTHACLLARTRFCLVCESSATPSSCSWNHVGSRRAAPQTFFLEFSSSVSVWPTLVGNNVEAAFLENQWCRQQPNGKALVIHGGEAQVGWPWSLVLQVKWQTLDMSTRLGA